MSTHEDRIASLEQKVADIELERLYERRKAESTPSEQAYDAQQVNYRLTMLLGVASGQEHDIKVIRNDLGSVREDVSTLKGDVNTLKGDVSVIKELLTQILVRLPEKP